MTYYYFDHAASAPRREEVLAAMTPFLSGVVGNPSGTHRAARVARRAIEDAREEIAGLTGVSPGGVVFTGGGTESCHMALAGVLTRAARTRGRATVAFSAVEHHSVSESAATLARDHDIDVRVLGVDAMGVVRDDQIDEFIDGSVDVVSIMTANNETGVVQPISEFAARVRDLAPNAVIHTDAVAAAPWLDLISATAGADLISLCAHKLGGPVNAGALLVRREMALDPVAGGGGQERGRRGGTVDVAAAVGLATALRLAAAERDEVTQRVGAFQSDIEERLSQIPGVLVTAPHANRLPGHVHLTIDGVASDEVLFLLDQHGICASAASSCSSGAGVASHVLDAMGVSSDRARGAIRFTMGAETTREDVAYLCDKFVACLRQLRENDVMSERVR